MHSIRALATLVYKILYFCDTIWQAAERNTTQAYSVSCSSKTPDANMRSPYVDTLLLEFMWLVTCVLRNHNMASNTWLTTVCDHELVKFTSSFR